MSSYAYYNGKFGKKDEISIPLSDRSIFFGDAVYDAAIGSYDRILWEEEHIERFLGNARKMGIEHKISKKNLSDLLREIAIKSMYKSYFLYFQLSRNLSERRHSSVGCGSNLLITIDPITIDPNPAPLKLITVNDDRHGYCDIKTTNLFASVLSSTKAELSNCDEAVFVRNNIVTECSKSNISIIKRGRLITHPENNRILPGIARRHLLTISRGLGIPCEERPYTVYELMEADEILVTSTTKLCQRANEINSLPVGDKDWDLADKICRLIHKEYVDFCLL